MSRQDYVIQDKITGKYWNAATSRLIKKKQAATIYSQNLINHDIIHKIEIILSFKGHSQTQLKPIQINIK